MPSLDCFEPAHATGGGMFDRCCDTGIRTHSAFGSNVGSESGGHCSGFGGSLRAIGDIGVRAVVRIGASAAGMFSLGVIDDDCHHQYHLQMASACLSGCIFSVGRFRRVWLQSVTIGVQFW